MGIEAEIEAQFAGSLEVEHHLDKFAEQIRDEIKDIAPVFDAERDRRSTPGIGDPEDYKDSIQVSGIKSPRKRRVESNDPKAVWIELGSKHMPEYAPFGKVAAMHGGTGPVIDEGVRHAQSKLREELEKMAKLAATGATAEAIAEQRREVARARTGRSAAFNAARPRRRGRGR